jgi:hypothetical protein
MSVLTQIYNALTNDQELREMLAINTVNGAPAVFEEWSPEFNEFPYINLFYSIGTGDHWAKREGIVTVDIYGNQDSTQLEKIKNRVIKILDRKILDENEPQQTRIYSGEDHPLQEDEPEIKRWHITFNLVFWRSDFADYLNSEGG